MKKIILSSFLTMISINCFADWHDDHKRAADEALQQMQLNQIQTELEEVKKLLKERSYEE